MQVNPKRIGGIVLVLVAIFAAAYFGGLFSITAGTPPTCTFTDTNKTCTYNYVLSAERATSLLTLNFDYAPVASTDLFGTTNVQATSTYTILKTSSSSGAVTTNNYYMYSMPQWEAYDVLVKVSGTHAVVCSGTGSKATTYISTNAIDRPWSGTNIVVNRREDELNNPALTNTTLIMTDNRYSLPTFYERNQFTVGGVQTNRCYRSSSDPVESFTYPYTLESVIPDAYVFDSDNTRFIVRAYKTIEGSSSATLDTPQVTVSYHKAFYPTDVAIKIGNLPVQTFSGAQKNTTTTLDIADQINLYCNRGVTIQECTVPITITSTQPGLLWVSKNAETLKVASENAVIAELEGTLAQQIAYINELDATIEEKAALIEQLTEKAELQGEIISGLNATIEEKAALIAELGATAQEQVVLIDSLKLNIEDQAKVINELAKNLEEKAYYVSQLEAENAQQAALIAAMKESFQNQGTILDNLNKTVEEDAYFINQLSGDATEQAQILAGMQNTIDREKAIVAELTAKVEEQQALIELAEKERAGAKNLVFVVVGLSAVAFVGGWLWLRRKK